MQKMTGMEAVQDIPSKVRLAYEAVQELIGEGRDVNDISVSAITERAGIGKGTIYDYFDAKEEIIACAFLYYIKRIAERISARLQEFGSLREQLNYIFDELDKDSRRKVCFVSFIHGATDNSKHSQLIRDKMHAAGISTNFSEYLFGDVFRSGIERGDIDPGIPADYFIYTIFCKLLTYMMSLSTEDCFCVDCSKMRNLIIEGILREMKGFS